MVQNYEVRIEKVPLAENDEFNLTGWKMVGNLLWIDKTFKKGVASTLHKGSFAHVESWKSVKTTSDYCLELKATNLIQTAFSTNLESLRCLLTIPLAHSPSFFKRDQPPFYLLDAHAGPDMVFFLKVGEELIPVFIKCKPRQDVS
ncbi:hypothetical protein HK098_000233 [Nowakowskiella sp. JEL0407]|nr:hypothetical protein HK098_000233 [Nowakowskiella sp. JEL0407]